MDSVPEDAADLASHPAAIEAAAELNSCAEGLRPQWVQIPSVAGDLRVVRPPTLNIRLAQRLALRQAAHEMMGQYAEVAEPHRLAFRSLLGARRVQLSETSKGYALNMEFAYRSPRGCVYVVTGVALGQEDGPLTGEGWARGCSCPDFGKRRGPGRDSLRGEARCCKHMRLLLALISEWRGSLPWVGCASRHYQKPGDGFKLQEFG